MLRRIARTFTTRRARASCSSVAGGQSGSETAAAWRSSSVMASKARQSVFGGRFGSSLNLVVLPFFMGLGASRRNDAGHIASDRIGDNEQPAVDEADRIEAGLARGIAVLEIDDEGIKEHLRGRPEVDAMLLAIVLLLDIVSLELHANLLSFSI